MNNLASDVFKDTKPSLGTEVVHPIISNANIKHRPRSSSINSNGSTKSNQTRSLSIVSIGSPQNSIVSNDDVGLRSSTRNNSTASLSSMNGNLTNFNISNPKFRDKDQKGDKSIKSKPLSFSSNVLLSDSESESDHKLIRPNLASLSRASSSKKSSLKKDFRFKFHENFKKLGTSNLSSALSIPHTPPTIPHILNHPLEPASASSSQASSPTNISLPPSIPSLSPIDAHPSPLSLNVAEVDTRNAKKSAIKASNYSLKKNLLFSKEIRMELAGKDPHIFKTKFIKNVSKTSSVEPSKMSPSTDLQKLPILSTLGNSTTSNSTTDTSSLGQQHLINEMNQKWSKKPDNVIDSKRPKRRYSSSSDDEF